MKKKLKKKCCRKYKEKYSVCKRCPMMAALCKDQRKRLKKTLKKKAKNA